MWRVRELPLLVPRIKLVRIAESNLGSWTCYLWMIIRAHQIYSEVEDRDRPYVAQELHRALAPRSIPHAREARFLAMNNVFSALPKTQIPLILLRIRASLSNPLGGINPEVYILPADRPYFQAESGPQLRNRFGAP